MTEPTALENPTGHATEVLEQISIERDYETRYWARTLHCTETELREAVRAVGTEVDDVRRHLGPRAVPASEAKPSF